MAATLLDYDAVQRTEIFPRIVSKSEPLIPLPGGWLLRLIRKVNSWLLE